MLGEYIGLENFSVDHLPPAGCRVTFPNPCHGLRRVRLYVRSPYWPGDIIPADLVHYLRSDLKEAFMIGVMNEIVPMDWRQWDIPIGENGEGSIGRIGYRFIDGKERWEEAGCLGGC